MKLFLLVMLALILMLLAMENLSNATIIGPVPVFTPRPAPTAARSPTPRPAGTPVPMKIVLDPCLLKMNHPDLKAYQEENCD